MTQHSPTQNQRVSIGLMTGLTLVGAAVSFLAFDMVANAIGAGLSQIPWGATMIQKDMATVLAGLGAVLASALGVPAAVHALSATSVRKDMRPWPFGDSASPATSMAISVGIGLAVVAGGEFASGVVQRLTAPSAFAYDAYARLSVFCAALLASTTLLAMSAMTLDMTAGRGGGHASRPRRSGRHLLWMFVTAVAFIFSPVAILTALAYLPALFVGPRLLDDVAAGGVYPSHLPFSWIGEAVNLSPAHAAAASVSVCLALTWIACKMAAKANRDAIEEGAAEVPASS